MHPTIVRTADPQDLQTLQRFQRAIIGVERRFDRTLKEGDIRYYDIEQMLAAENVRFVIAESADTPVGCGFARIEPAKTYLKHTLQGYLGLMYVIPEFRGRQVNAKVVRALQDWCRARDVAELRLEVYADNLAAVSAYKKTGFAGHMLEMRMNLDGD